MSNIKIELIIRPEIAFFLNLFIKDSLKGQKIALDLLSDKGKKELELICNEIEKQVAEKTD